VDAQDTRPPHSAQNLIFLLHPAALLCQLPRFSRTFFPTGFPVGAEQRRSRDWGPVKGPVSAGGCGVSPVSPRDLSLPGPWSSLLSSRADHCSSKESARMTVLRVSGPSVTVFGLKEWLLARCGRNGARRNAYCNTTTSSVSSSLFLHLHTRETCSWATFAP
jgi:hypothetical protein